MALSRPLLRSFLSRCPRSRVGAPWFLMPSCSAHRHAWERSYSKKSDQAIILPFSGRGQLTRHITPVGSDYFQSSSVIHSSVNSSSLDQQRSFHTTRSCKALPQVFLLLVRPLMNISAFLFGRTIKKWWKKLPEEKRKKVLNNFKTYKYYIFGLLGVYVFGIALFYFSHLEKHPLTQRRRFILFTPKDMQNFCQTVENVVVETSQSDILPAVNPLYRRVERVMVQIMKANEEEILKSGVHEWRIYVFQDPQTRNAMVLPNGTVFIYSGIMDLCSTDDELGTVLCHEAAHTILNHQGEMMSRQHFIDAFLMHIIALLWTVLPDAAALVSQIFASKATDVLIHLPFSRLMETEADTVGLKMAAKACFDVRVASAFWAKMAILADLQGEQAPEEFLSTHPGHETRQKNLDDLIPDALKLRDLCQCPRLSSADPRQYIDIWKQQLKAPEVPPNRGISIILSRNDSE